MVPSQTLCTVAIADPTAAFAVVFIYFALPAAITLSLAASEPLMSSSVAIALLTSAVASSFASARDGSSVLCVASSVFVHVWCCMC